MNLPEFPVIVSNPLDSLADFDQIIETLKKKNVSFAIFNVDHNGSYSNGVPAISDGYVLCRELDESDLQNDEFMKQVKRHAFKVPTSKPIITYRDGAMYECQ